METSVQTSSGWPKAKVAHRRLFTFWLAIAVFLTILYRWPTAVMPYVYTHAWGSAAWATMGRSFANHGIIALGAVPIENNPPLGLRPVAYTDWPPLLPMILGVSFRIFGESEATEHRVMLAFALATALLLFWIGDLCLGRTGACLAAFCWLTLPTVVHWGHLATPENPVTPFLLAGLLAFLNATTGDAIRWRWGIPGIVAIVLTAWTSWEGVLLCPGLLAAALWSRKASERRLAIIYCFAAVIAAISIFVCYFSRYPSLLVQTLHAAKLRMGLSTPSWSDHLSPWRILTSIAWNHSEEIGLLGLVATAWVIFSGLEARRHQQGGAQAMVFCGLLAPWFLWSILMSNQMAIHSFETLIAAPAVAMSLAWCGKEALNALARSEQGRLGLRSIPILLVVPFLMLEPFGEALRSIEFHRGTGWRKFVPLAEVRSELMKPDDMMRLGNELREACGSDAVILSPMGSPVPLHYSRRHIIRWILNDDFLDQALPQVAADFPGSPLYLALQPIETQLSNFPRALSRYSRLKSTPDLILLDLERSRDAHNVRQRRALPTTVLPAK